MIPVLSFIIYARRTSFNRMFFIYKRSRSRLTFVCMYNCISTNSHIAVWHSLCTLHATSNTHNKLHWNCEKLNRWLNWKGTNKFRGAHKLDTTISTNKQQQQYKFNLNEIRKQTAAIINFWCSFTKNALTFTRYIRLVNRQFVAFLADFVVSWPLPSRCINIDYHEYYEGRIQKIGHILEVRSILKPIMPSIMELFSSIPPNCFHFVLLLVGEFLRKKLLVCHKTSSFFSRQPNFFAIVFVANNGIMKSLGLAWLGLALVLDFIFQLDLFNELPERFIQFWQKYFPSRIPRNIFFYIKTSEKK